MKSKNAVGVTITVMVILGVIILVFFISMTIGIIGPAAGRQIEDRADWIHGDSYKCANIQPIDATMCAEGTCTLSYSYNDISTYAVALPIPTEYWVNVTVLPPVCTYADNNPLSNEAGWCSNNDPDTYLQHEYQPLVYEVSIGNAVGRYIIPTDTCCQAGTCPAVNQEIKIYVGTVNSGNYDLRWRIATGWYDDGNVPAPVRTLTSLPAGVNPDLGLDCVGVNTGSSPRRGELTGEIKVYCEV